MTKFNPVLAGFLRKFGGFAFLLAILGVTGVTEVVWAVSRQRSVRTTQRQVQKLRKELRDFEKLELAPTTANLAALEEELASAKKACNEIRRRLTPAANSEFQEFDDAELIERADGFFEIASFVERTRDHARSLGILLSPDERFGFSAFAHSGPSAAELTAVLNQRAITEQVLLALFDAQPRELVSVECEVSSEDADTDKAVRTGRGSDGADLSAHSRLSLRHLAGVRTKALKLSFTGQTVTLRFFLNRLLLSDLPLAVREVEIASLSRRPKVTAGVASEPEPVQPLVERSLSRFTVTIESYQFASSEEAAG